MKRFLLPFAVAVLLVGVVVAGAMLLRDDGTKPAAAATPSAAKLAKQKRVWIRHAGAVCRWIGRRDATLARAYRSGFQSLDHVASVVEYIYAVHRQAAGVFRRLTPPPSLRAPAQRLERLLHAHLRHVRALSRALREVDLAHLRPQIRALRSVSRQMRRLFRHLGVKKCAPPHRHEKERPPTQLEVER